MKSINKDLIKNLCLKIFFVLSIPLAIFAAFGLIISFAYLLYNFVIWLLVQTNLTFLFVAIVSILILIATLFVVNEFFSDEYDCNSED